MAEQDPRQDKRERIYRAALEAFARYGIQNATARQIADMAGIGKSTIFEYFRSTDELMDAAFAWYIGQSSAGRAGMRALAEKDPCAALSAYFDGMTSLIVEDPGKLLLISQYVTAILASGTDFSDVKREYAAKLLPSAESLLEDFKAIAAAGISSGAFRPAGGSGADDCALIVNAIAREMQAQAFVQDEAKIRETCDRLKSIAFRFLGLNIKNSMKERI